MSRKAQFIGFGIGILLLLFSLISFYLLSGASDANTYIAYTLGASNPASDWLDVRLVIEPGLQHFVDLYLHNPVQNGRQRIQYLQVTRAGQYLAHWQAVPGQREILRFDGTQAPRSYLDGQFGYIRGMIALYTPISLSEIVKSDFSRPGIDEGYAEMLVHLPQGWQMVSPWGSEEVHTPAATLRNGYISLGPFMIQDLLYGNSPLLVGTYTSLDPIRFEELSRQVPLLFEAMRDLTGFDPVSQTCYWSLAVLPKTPIDTSVSGIGSLVVNDDLSTIARRMFSWWKGQTLITTHDAAWFKEGFTMYYSAKALWKSGLWTEHEFTQEMESFAQNISAGSQAHPINLIEFSNRFTYQDEEHAYNPVYYGGGLLAYMLDSQLVSQGKSLDHLWAALIADPSPVSTQVFLHKLEKLGGSDLARLCSDILYGNKFF